MHRLLVVLAVAAAGLALPAAASADVGRVCIPRGGDPWHPPYCPTVCVPRGGDPWHPPLICIND